MTPDNIREFMEKEALSASKLALIMGISRDRLRKMLRNQTPIPPWFDLACAAIVYDLPPWPWRLDLNQMIRKENPQ